MPIGNIPCPIFSGAAGSDALGVPLLDAEKMQATRDQQQKHVACIQDMAGVSLYRETGQTTRGGVVLTKYHCHRGSTSLESFHRHLPMFVPG